MSIRSNQTQSTLADAFGPRLEFGRELAPLTTFKTGGPAQYYYQAETTDEVSKAIKTASQLDLSYFVIGGGSNLLISDAGFDGLIIKVAVKGLRLDDPTEIRCGAGEKLMSLVEFAAENSLAGLEFASGIAGLVGGAICGNAGAYGGEIKDVLTEVVLVDRAGKIKSVKPDYCKFAYRDSHLKESGEIVVEASFRLKSGNSSKIKNKVSEILEVRESKHPVEGKTAGSFFKNIEDSREKHGKLPAGRLLEEAGAIGLSVGGAKVYEKHANMIVNTGNATSKDIRDLADIMIMKVQNKFGITLKEEVVQIGNF